MLNSFLKVTLCICLILGLFLLGDNALAAPASYEKIGQALNTNPDIPWNLEADSVMYNRQSDTYSASGNVVLSQPDKEIRADYLEMNRTSMQVLAKGNVELFVQDDYLASESIDIDLSNETGEIKVGYIFIRQTNFHINGSRIAKTGESNYEIEGATLTSCDGPDPDWRIESSRAEITIDGYGYAYDTVFYIGNLPILYTPFFAFPAKTSRQTGLLFPQASYSNRFGASLTVPFFWAIDENQDATFYAQYMTKRGLKLGGEYRYDMGDYRGTMQADGLHDIRTDPYVGNKSNDYGYDDGDGDAPRKNKDRFWLRGIHQQTLPWNMKLTAQLDFVSDQDYLREFNSGYMGYDVGKKHFLDNYSWDLEGNEDFIRTSKVLLNRTWEASSLNVEAVWFDNIIARKNDFKNFTVQKLPSISYDVRKQKIGDLPLFFSLDSEYGHFWREDGPTAQRIDIHPRVFMPINFGLFTLEPSAGFRETGWYEYNGELENTENRNSFNRVMLDTRTRLSTQFTRIYDFEESRGQEISKLKHSITPEIIYDYIPKQNQDDLPYYTSIDRIQERNQVFASFTTAFNTKMRVNPNARNFPAYTPRNDLNREMVENEIENPTATYRYIELLRLNLKQGYDFNANQGNKNDSIMPLYGQIKLTPFDGLTLTADAAWSFNTDEFVSRNISATLWDSRGDYLFVEWRNNKDYDDPYNLSDIYPGTMFSRYYINNNAYLNYLDNPADINTLFSSAIVRVTDNIDLFGSTEYNFADHTKVENFLGARYSEQCWAVELVLRDRKDGDYTVALFFTLLSLGSVGF